MRSLTGAGIQHVLYEVALAAFFTMSMSAVLTAASRKLAGSLGMVDVPNARSSHTAAVPRGGGAAIVVASSITLGALAVTGLVSLDLLLAMVGGGIPVAVVGLLDDRYTVPPLVRLAVHIAAASWAVYWLGGAPALQFGGRVLQPGWPGDVLAVLGIVWALNLFNFMDGIDGIAASEAVFVACAALVPMALCGVSSSVLVASVVFAAAGAGFLPWNWPPATIFMGDVGSGYTGYALGVLALAAAHERPTTGWAWLILGGVFFVDATLTLMRRLLRGEQVHQAHRSHAYQWLARRWGSHRRVTVTVLAVNILWLLPWATFAAVRPAHAAAAALIALAPLVLAALATGAGRREVPARVPP
jgi:Fuc2NAc and GlcNAc transferase